jgi:hypothetical protein
MKTLTRKISFIKHSLLSVAILSLGLIAGEASATLVLFGQNGAPQTGNAQSDIDLSGSQAGIQSTRFFNTTVANQWVRIIFNAEATIGGATTNWLDDTIFVDGAPCSPSSSDNALVSGNGTASENDGWISAVTQCLVQVPTPGAHSFRVQVTPFPAAPWRVDDISFVIDTQ